MTVVRARLADGSEIEGELGGWIGGDFIELDGRRWDGLVAFYPIDDDEGGSDD